LAAPYRRWVATLDELTADLPNELRAQLWADNARHFYRLPRIKRPLGANGISKISSTDFTDYTNR